MPCPSPCRPDLDTIIQAAPLLEVENVHADAFLGVGSLVQAYCRDHPTCTDAAPVLRVMEALHGFIANSCRRETSQEKIQVSWWKISLKKVRHVWKWWEGDCCGNFQGIDCWL